MGYVRRAQLVVEAARRGRQQQPDSNHGDPARMSTIPGAWFNTHFIASGRTPKLYLAHKYFLVGVSKEGRLQ